MAGKSIFRTALASATLFAIAIFWAGCAVPLNHVGAFSQASADLAKQAADAYEYVNETTIEQHISDIAADPNLSPDDDTFEKLIVDSDLAARISLLRGVENYAKALGDLASADFRKEIDAASKDLYGSLGKLQNTYASIKKEPLPLSDKDLAIIATAIDLIGTTIAEKQRRAALKTIVIQTNFSIQNAMKLVSSEIPALKSLVLANLDVIWTDKVKAYQKEVMGLSFDQRVAKLRDIRKSYECIDIASRLLDGIVSASRKISDAHAALQEAVKADKFTTEKMVKEIKNLTELAKSIKQFHDKLLTAKE